MQDFTDESWTDFQKELAVEYAFTRATLGSTNEFFDEGHVLPTIANIAHAAYPLGAIRALVPTALAAE